MALIHRVNKLPLSRTYLIYHEVYRHFSALDLPLQDAAFLCWIAQISGLTPDRIGAEPDTVHMPRTELEEVMGWSSAVQKQHLKTMRMEGYISSHVASTADNKTIRVVKIDQEQWRNIFVKEHNRAFEEIKPRWMKVPRLVREQLGYGVAAINAELVFLWVLREQLRVEKVANEILTWNIPSMQKFTGLTEWRLHKAQDTLKKLFLIHETPRAGLRINETIARSAELFAASRAAEAIGV